jgi:hypothetical protein
MGRQYAMLAHEQDATLVRYERMGPAFNATWRPIIERFYPEVRPWLGLGKAGHCSRCVPGMHCHLACCWLWPRTT